MINRKSLELWVGLFVAAGILALAMLRVQGRQPNLGGCHEQLQGHGAFDKSAVSRSKRR